MRFLGRPGAMIGPSACRIIALPSSELLIPTACAVIRFGRFVQRDTVTPKLLSVPNSCND